jgi:tRNA threonylcarbamoyladenosine biosynthesis protein TsaE
MDLDSEAETEELGIALARLLKAGDVVTLEGDLGTGKTVLARGIARGLGVEGDIASPTFPIVQVYEGEGMRLPLWHVDLYRIENPAELDELGLDEAREDNVLVIEWPERLGERVWPDALQLRLEARGTSARALTAIVPEAWEGRWPPT